MKRYIFILIIFTSFWANAQESNRALWKKANDFYTDESYEKAIKTYNQILGRNEVSAELYYNLGNAYYKTGAINNAILYYERALKLDPDNEDIIFNLGVANQQVVTKVEETREPFFTRWSNKISHLYPVETWGFISLAAFILLLACIALYIFTKKSGLKKLGFFSAIAFLLITIASYSIAANLKHKMKQHKEAIIFCPRVSVKSSPNEKGKDLFLIYEGLKVKIIQSQENWSKITLSDGSQGWMPDSCMVKI